MRFIHILLSMVVAGWLMASCTSNVPYDESSKSGLEVQFATSDVSRSSVSTNLNYAGSEFAIFGDMKLGGSSSSSENIVVFNGDPVSYFASKWIYANTRYWFPEHEHSFVAVHPATPVGASDMTYSDSSLSFGYTLPDAFGDTPDLLVATHRRMYEEQTSTPVAPVMLRFVHIMSRINFLLTNVDAAETVKVTKIEFEKIDKSGVFTVTPAPLLSGSKQTDDYNLSWTDGSNKGTLTADIAVDVPETEMRPLFPDNNALFVIPQPDNEGIIMKITYTLIYKNGNTEERTSAASTPIGGWKPEKVYTYSLSIESEIKAIEMNVSVEDWKIGPVDDVQVPRK